VPALGLLTWNIHHGVWTDGRRGIEPLRALCARHDIVCLNEASRNQAEEAARGVGMYCSSSDHSETGDNPYSNNAILSRYPIEESRVHQLPLFWGIPWRRRLLQATLNVQGCAVHVLAAHLSFLPLEGARHVGRTAETFDRLSGPRLLCGDLNASPSHPEVRRISQSYRDAWGVAGFGDGLTFGTRFGLRRIDYVFASSHFRVETASMPDTRQPDGAFPSDHHPVAATLSWS
jgi:endonuclease/exonuclease/phosphatase family metal-dependent hydrolase